jgi:hypothetical protein
VSVDSVESEAWRRCDSMDMTWWVGRLTGIERLAATRSGRYSHGGCLGYPRVQQCSLDLAGGPWVSTDKGSMVSTLGAGRGRSRGGRAQAGFAGGGRRSGVLVARQLRGGSSFG